MTTKIIQNTAVIESNEVIITDTQSALDFIATVRYDTGCDAVAINGDFSVYASRALRDFIRESNEGSHIFFVATEQEAALKLSGV